MTRVVAPLWRQHDFRIAWSAGFVNDTGDWLLTVALPVFVFIETGSGAATAMLFVCQLAAGAVLGPIGGSLVDRWDLRRCLIVTNVAQALAVLPLLAVDDQRIWPAYVVMLTQASLTQVNNPANVALIPRVVDVDRLTTANAALAASSSLARLVGSPLGGLLVAWRGLGPVVAVDAISFVIVGASLWFLRSDTTPLPNPEGPGGLQLRAGGRAARENPPLISLLILQGIAQLAQGGFVVLFVAFVIDTLGDDGSGLGLIRGTMAIGALVGSALIAHFASQVDPPFLYSCGLTGMGLVSVAFWNAPAITTALWAYIALFTLSGIPGSAVTVGLFTTVQTRSPPHAIGRIVGLLGTAEAIGTATGSIAAGALIDHVGLRPLLNAQAAIYLVTGALAATLVTRRIVRRAGETRRRVGLRP